jgi:large subunit ribosomal protein L33
MARFWPWDEKGAGFCAVGASFRALAAHRNYLQILPLDRRLVQQFTARFAMGLAVKPAFRLKSSIPLVPDRPRPAPRWSFRMAKSKKKVETVFLVCEQTGDYNYTIRRKSGGEKLKLSKYSPRLRKHTTHVEKKK